jgi:hypothetical protein
VNMRIAETRQQPLAAAIHYPSCGSMPGLNFRIRPNRHNALAKHGDRLSFRARRIHSPDLRIPNNEIGRRLPLPKSRNAQAKNKGERRHDCPPHLQSAI